MKNNDAQDRTRQPLQIKKVTLRDLDKVETQIVGGGATNQRLQCFTLVTCPIRVCK